jgi:hypothetical protein
MTLQLMFEPTLKWFVIRTPDNLWDKHACFDTDAHTGPDFG